MVQDYSAELHNIKKSFPGVLALNNVSFKLKKGEVMALLGENGAGKSTLMNILSGSLTADKGHIQIGDKSYETLDPLLARRLGVSMIHQELQLIPELSIAENIFLGRWERDALGFVKFKEIFQSAHNILKLLDWDIDTRVKVSDLRIGEKQLVEIAKALSLNSQILIMDEPTSALSESEVEKLFTVIHKLRQDNKSIIYITHRMEEVFKISDRLMIMRDGEHVITTEAKNITQDEIIAHMVGRQVNEQFPKNMVAKGDFVLEIEGLSFAPKQGSFKRALESISLNVKAGEVLGIAGLAGSGRSELLESIAGRYGSKVKGRIILNGKELNIKHPKDAIKSGISLITEDRKGTGLISNRNIGENLSLPLLKEFSKFGFMLASKEKTVWKKYMEKLRVKASSARVMVSTLSGGNQQKVLLARWLMTHPKVLMLDEPTRGIDVGAKEEIYRLINQLAENGLAIILVSSELPEILGISDRIITLCEGRITGEFESSEANQETLMRSATMNSIRHSE